MALTKVTGHVVKPDTNIQFHNTKSTGIVTFTHTNNATSSTTGALQVTGGVGIVKDLHVGGNVTVGGTLTYDDVTNIDSIGIVTARAGIEDKTLTAGHVVFAGTAGRLSGEANLFYDSSNDRLGIGTAAPATKLHVDGGNLTIRNGTAAGVILSEESGVGGSLKVTTATGSASFGPGNSSFCHIQTSVGQFYFNKQIVVDQGIVGSYDEDLQLHSPLNTRRVTINKTTGHVGIGTDNPGRPLTITHSDPRIRLQDSDSGGHAEIYTDNNNHLYLTADSSSSSGSSRIVFQTDGANEKARIDNNGNFIFYNSTTAWNKIQRANAAHYAGIAIQESDATQRMQFGVAGTTNHIVNGAAQHDVVLKAYDANLILATNATERVRIDSSGRLKVGTNTRPASDANEGAGLRVTASLTRNQYYSPAGQYFGAIGYTDNTNTKAWLAVDSGYAQSSAVSAGIFLSAFHQDAGGSGSGFTIKNLKTGNPLVFSSVTTASSTGNPAVETERLRIKADGVVIIGPGAVDSPKASTSGLDVSSGIYSIIMGGETNVGTGDGRRNAQQKESRLGMPHYTNAEEPFGLVYGVTISGENRLNLGGGSSIVNAATSIKFYTAANTTTTAGTARLEITSAGKLIISNHGTNNLRSLSVLAPQTQIQFGTANDVGGFLMSSNNGQFGLSGGAYWTGSNWVATHTGSAQIRHDGGGTMVFCTNASLTSGNNFTPSVHMRIDSSGNILFGTTSSTVYDDTSGSGVVIRSATGAVDIMRNNDHPLLLNRTGGDGQMIMFHRDGVNRSAISVRNNDFIVDMPSGTEKFRITSSGNVAINGDTNNVPRHLWLYNASNDPYFRIQRGSTGSVIMGGIEIASSNGNGNNVLSTMLTIATANSGTTGATIFQVRDQANNYEVVRLCSQSQGSIQGNRMLVNGNQVCVFGGPLGTSGAQARNSNVTTYNTVYEHSSSSYRTSDNGMFGGTFVVGGNADRWYPVWFQQPVNSPPQELWLNKYVHNYATWDGTLNFRASLCGTGYGAYTVQHRVMFYSSSAKNFIGKILYTSHNNAYLVLWMRGGGRSYGWGTTGGNGITVNVGDDDGSHNLGPGNTAETYITSALSIPQGYEQAMTTGGMHQQSDGF